MDSTKIIDISSASIPQEAHDAFAWNSRLTKSEYRPPWQGEIREDGSVAAFISADSKAILFFDDCLKNGKEGRIVNDEVTYQIFGNFLLVQAKAYVYINDTLKGTAVAGQSILLTNEQDPNQVALGLDRIVQVTSGLAKSRALTNAGYGVVSGVTIPTPDNVPDKNPSAGTPPPPFESANSPSSYPAAGRSMPNQMPGTANTPPTFSNDPKFNDPIVWAKNVFWAAKKKTMGELLNTSPKDIKWAAESMSQDCDVKRAAALLYPEACRMLGVAPKPLK